MAKTWLGPVPDKCQICGTHLTEVFIDGKTRFGPWAIMCAACHRDQAYGLGTGLGQKYDLNTLEKIDG